MSSIPGGFRSSRRASQRGFTLLEVLIAVAVLAVASAGLVSAAGRNLQQAGYLEEKTLALWVAENAMTELRLLPQWPALGRRTDRVDMANRQWALQIEVKKTSNPGLRRVEIEVAPAGQDERVLAALVGFVGER